MVHYCTVPSCNGVGGFRFPEDKQLKKKWQIAIKREGKNKKLWEPKKASIVCEKHFKPEDFREKNIAGFPLKNRCLKSGVVPSIFYFSKKIDYKRQERAQQREKNKQEICQPVEVEDIDIEFAMEVEISDTVEEVADEGSLEEEAQPCMYSQGVQVSLNPTIGSLKVSQFEKNPKAINYYTGFKDITHFLFFLAVLGPAAACLKYSSRTLSIEDELFLCLIKLRLCKGKCFLCRLFTNRSQLLHC